MKITTFDESIAHDIGHAFGYYDYGDEHGLADAFQNRDAVAEYIGGYVRMRGIYRVQAAGTKARS